MFTLQDTADAPPQMVFDNHECTSSMSSLLKKALQNGPNIHILEKSLKVVTRQITPYGSPKIQWDPLCQTDQALFTKVTTDHRRTMVPHIGHQLSHRGVSRTIKSLVCALCTGSSKTEPTINSTLYTFIEQVNIYDL